MKTWNFGIIGAGVIADFHAAAISDIPQAKLIGVCDIVLERAKKMADKHFCRIFKDFDEMVQNEDIDIVTIATPSGLHMEPALAAAQAGKHAICEKPLDVTLERIDKMIDAHKKAGTYLGGIFQNRFCEIMPPLTKAINTGRFGMITYVGAYVPWWRTKEYYKDCWNSWHGTWKLDGGGALMNQAIHTIDRLCYLMPPVRSVQAYADSVGHPEIETEDTAVAILCFANGALGVLYGSTASYPGHSKRFEITGTKGTVVCVDDQFTVWQFADEKPEDQEICENFAQTKNTGAIADPADIFHKNHARNFEAFIDSIESKQEFSIDGPEARKAVELTLAIYKAAKQGAPVKLE